MKYLVFVLLAGAIAFGLISDSAYRTDHAYGNTLKAVSGAGISENNVIVRIDHL